MLLADLAQVHRTKMAARGYSDPTLRLYDLAQRRFIGFLSAKLDRPPTLADLTLDHAEAFQIALRADRLTNRSIGSYSIMLRSWAGWIATYIPEVFANANPIGELVPPKPERRVPDRLSTQEINALLGACDSTQYPERNQAIILLLWDSGLRISELVALQRRDVRLAEGGRLGRVHVRNGKGSKERWSGCGERTSDMIRSYLATSLGTGIQSDDWLFRGRIESPLQGRGIRAMLGKLAIAADVDPERAHPHALRHSFGRGQVRIGVNTLAIKARLGHEDTKMTNLYAELEESDLDDTYVSLVDHSLRNTSLPKRQPGRSS